MRSVDDGTGSISTDLEPVGRTSDTNASGRALLLASEEVPAIAATATAAHGADAAAAAEHGNNASGATDEHADADTIATRTRTKLSLVDVQIDTLESCLPDIVEPILLDDEDDHEYQRFLSSLLPNEQENLSFLDEEDEAYEPPPDNDDDEDDDDEDDDDDDGDIDVDGLGDDSGDTAAAAHAKPRVAPRITKKELTELLWDSTRLGLPLLSAATAAARSDSSGARQQPLAPSTSSSNSSSRDATAKSSSSSGPRQQPLPFASMCAVPPPLPSLTKPAARFRRLRDNVPPALVQELHGAISQDQCLQLASQLHKHVQLLLQSLSLATAPRQPTKASEENESVATETTETAEPTEASRETDATKQTAVATAERRLDAQRACRQMLDELQTRGARAQQCKSVLLARLSQQQQQTQQPNGFGTGAGVTSRSTSRRVTRSLTAAHAAVAHPSMFELVGPQTPIDDLVQAFATQCDVTARDDLLREQLFEVDRHLLGAAKKSVKKPFTPYEDKLLAHGAKRFALHADIWTQIERNFLPRKSLAVIQRRYRYLVGRKDGTSAVKQYHAQFPRRRSASWILEEDLRIARGLVAYHGNDKRYARVVVEHLPHRGRAEVRKRWKRICSKLAPVVAEQHPGLDTASIDYAVVVKDLLEDKLREQVKQQTLELMEHNGDGGNDSDVEESQRYPFGIPMAPIARAPWTHRGGNHRSGAYKFGSRYSQLPHVKTATCAAKHLHPALFFTSWALIDPATLLRKTCEHNWPSFIDAMAAQQQAWLAQQQHQAELEASHVVMSATDPNTVDGAAAPVPQVVADIAVATEYTDELSAAAGTLVTIGENHSSSSDALVAAHPDDSMTDATANSAPTAVSTIAAPTAATPAPSESELSTANNMSVAALDDDEDDDSDYEHDELVSSDNDEYDSDSDDFEQLELSDDDDDEDDDDDDDFDYEELDLSDDNDTSDDVAAAAIVTGNHLEQSSRLERSGRASPAPTAPADVLESARHAPSAPIRHTLRLQQLQQPNDAHTQRVLAALERRIVGACSKHNAPVKPPAARPNSKRRVVAHVARADASASSAADDAFASALDVADALRDFDLATDEVLAPSSGDDSFEREALSSDDDGDDDDDADGRASSAWQPNKKVKLTDATCSACGSAAVACRCSYRCMAQLLQRMRRAPSSSS